VVKRVSLIYMKLPSGGEWRPNFQVYFKIVVVLLEARCFW